MNGPRMIAGFFSGSAALLLIYQGHYEPAIAIIASMLGFFVGESNGKKTAEAKTP